jgi:hypothetical protein
MKRANARTNRYLLATLSVITLAWTSVSRAEEPPPPSPALEGAPPTGEVPAQPPPEMPPPVVTPPVPPPPPPRRVLPPPRVTETEDADEVDTDLDVEQRRVGIGYAGISQIPVGGPTGNLIAPAVGARIWINRKVGIDVALGVGWVDGSTKTDRIETDLDAVYGFILQGGVPLALSTHKHVSFQVIPYAAYAHGRTSTTGGAFGGAKIDFSGTRFDLGARAGLEVFWGFIGLPQLSLSATVGAALEVRKLSSEGGLANESTITYGFFTTVQSSPWDIFTGNVAARYYF